MKLYTWHTQSIVGIHKSMSAVLKLWDSKDPFWYVLFFLNPFSIFHLLNVGNYFHVDNSRLQTEDAEWGANLPPQKKEKIYIAFSLCETSRLWKITTIILNRSFIILISVFLLWQCEGKEQIDFDFFYSFGTFYRF